MNEQRLPLVGYFVGLIRKASKEKTMHASQ